MTRLKTVLVWTVLVVLVLVLFQVSGEDTGPQVEFAAFIEDVNSGAVAEVRAHNNQIFVTRWDGASYSTLGVVDDELTRGLSRSGVLLSLGEASRPMRTLLVYGLPLLLIIALFVYFLRKAQGGGLNIMELKKSRARLLEANETVTFDEVGGCEEAKQALADVVDYLREPERWASAGVRLPRGVLLEGPPGCGKTLLARAVAGETSAKFYAVSASEFVELFVGVGAARMRDTFEVAAKEAPAVIFIDELDAIGRRRGTGATPAHEEREQALNQLLVSMDGFGERERVVVIAATNRPDVLDTALVRPGRFDRRVRVPALSAAQRSDVLHIHTRGKQLGEDVSLDAVAAQTEGFSGAQLEALANEAGLRAVRRARRPADASESTEEGESTEDRESRWSAADVRLCQADFDEALSPSDADAHRRFDQVDSLLMESASQLAQSTGKAVVRITLAESTVVEGELVWADALFVKLRCDDDSPGDGVLIAKAQIKTIEALEGTAWAADGDVAPDQWAGSSTVKLG